MKVGLQPDNEFKSINLTVTFETEEEFNQILLMSCYQYSISEYANKLDKKIKVSTIKKFLYKIYLAMNNKK